jgi:hypothetical protein
LASVQAMGLETVAVSEAELISTLKVAHLRRRMALASAEGPGQPFLPSQPVYRRVGITSNTTRSRPLTYLP